MGHKCYLGNRDVPGSFGGLNLAGNKVGQASVFRDRATGLAREDGP